MHAARFLMPTEKALYMQLAPTKGKGLLVGVWATTKYLFDPEGPAEQATWLYEPL